MRWSDRLHRLSDRERKWPRKTQKAQKGARAPLHQRNDLSLLLLRFLRFLRQSHPRGPKAGVRANRGRSAEGRPLRSNGCATECAGPIVCTVSLTGKENGREKRKRRKREPERRCINATIFRFYFCVFCVFCGNLIRAGRRPAFEQTGVGPRRDGLSVATGAPQNALVRSFAPSL